MVVPARRLRMKKALYSPGTEDTEPEWKGRDRDRPR